MFIDCIDYKTPVYFVCNQPKLKLKYRIEKQNIFVLIFLSSYMSFLRPLNFTQNCNLFGSLFKLKLTNAKKFFYRKKGDTFTYFALQWQTFFSKTTCRENGGAELRI